MQELAPEVQQLQGRPQGRDRAAGRALGCPQGQRRALPVPLAPLREPCLQRTPCWHLQSRQEGTLPERQ